MKKIFLTIFFAVIISYLPLARGWGWLLATHNRAGEITYRWISGFKYEIIVTTYTRTSSTQADRCSIEINYGDGSAFDTIDRVNGSACPTGTPPCDACGEVLSNPDIKKNIYKTEHIYSGPGIYTLSVDDPNRNADVVNVPNSVNTSFYIESVLYISPFGGVNNSPVLDFPPIDVACASVLFEHNPGAHDPDGDILVFSLVPNMGADGSQIPNYSYPNNVPGCASGSLNINSSTGLLTWDSPVCCPMGTPPPEHEEFNIAILIEEYRNGKKIGSILRDMQIEVECDCPNDPPYIIAPAQMCVFAGDTIDTAIVAADPNGDIVTLTASGEPLSLSNSPASLIPPLPLIGDSIVLSRFHWNTNCGHVRNNLYNVIFRAEDDDDHVPLVDYHTMEIKIIAPRVENPEATPTGNSIVLIWDASFCSSGYKIYRRIDSAGFTLGSCQTGLPPGTGYSLIADCNSVTGTSYTDDNNGAGLVHGQKYCYVVIACLPGGAENVVSEEFCAELKNDIPIITNVSVFITDIASGGDSIMWSMPEDLDTLQYLPPYQYKIYRSDGFNSASVLIGTTSPGNILSFTDTFFVDTFSLNTKEKPHTYKVELLSNNTSVGYTTNASSVFLSSSATDNALQLSWEEHVPWANSKYLLYKKNSLGAFDFLSTVASASYTDTGLVNGEEYCYYVQSVGTYSSPGIIDTILNNSQVHCNKPYDNIAPCAPDTLLVQADCNLSQNTLTWNNPNYDCADDVVGYKIYYTPILGGDLVFIERISSSSDTSFLNGDLVSIAGCYAVSALDTNLNESTLSDTVCVDNCPEYELPNIFTPGEDGKNDFFHPFSYKFIAKINIQIFNRWGQMVFESTDPDIMWDGKHFKSKKICPAGVYYYVCQVHEIRLTGIETKVLKGYVHLLSENGGSAQPNN